MLHIKATRMLHHHGEITSQDITIIIDGTVDYAYFRALFEVLLDTYVEITLTTKAEVKQE